MQLWIRRERFMPYDNLELLHIVRTSLYQRRILFGSMAGTKQHYCIAPLFLPNLSP